MKSYVLISIFLLTPFLLLSQKKATLSGTIIDENGMPLPNTIIQILATQKQTICNALGKFSIQVPSSKPFALIISHVGYKSIQKNFLLSKNEQEEITVQLTQLPKELKEVIIQDDRNRKEAGRINIDASKALINPSPLNNIESLIKIFVGSNNELTSQYNVRGGNYDENSIYVNDFEVYRPYLIKSGQQEGLSFINPELTSNVKFYNGGFSARYGDKMSSVLDITYKKPVKNGGSAYISLLEQGLSIEGISNNKKTTYVLGIRNRSNRNLLSSQDTKGNYIPSSGDFQTYITHQVSPKWSLESFINFSGTRFLFYPEESKITSAVFSKTYASYLGVNTFFEGQEKDKYNTSFIGLSAIYQPKYNVKLKWMFGSFQNKEFENVDIKGAYLFGDVDADKQSNTFGQIVNPLGAGEYQNFSRNTLTLNSFTLAHKGTIDFKQHFYSWGLNVEFQKVNDKINEWQYNDSAGYSLPYNPGNLALFQVLKSTNVLNVVRLSCYFQDNWQLNKNKEAVLQYGVRFNYNDMNREWLISPRLGFSYKPLTSHNDIVYKASVGIYQQPPFYRELRKPDGGINTNLKAQKSWQTSIGLDYNFKLFDRPAKLTSELYYKNMWDVVPCDIDNVRIRYFGENSAKAYAAGFETRLYGELVKDAESWFSFGLMKTEEKINNFNYYLYKNAAGEIINGNSSDKIVKDSVLQPTGWIRRPTDRLLTIGMFFQDYLSTNKNIKFYMNALYGSNLPYNIPGSVRFRNGLTIDPYIRIDLGFSAQLLNNDKSTRRSHSPFKNLESIWASLEIFNVIDRANTISYLLIKDFNNNTFAMPNRLTSRLINCKLVVRW